MWTSHPFSVAWMSKGHASLDEKRNSRDSLNTLIDEPQRTIMSFLIKGKDGFTKTLLRKAHRSA